MTPSELYPLICVRDPYFALESLEAWPDGTVTATLHAEQPLLGEVGPMAAAEAGRHLAILGSRSAALSNSVTGRHYYIAREATLTRSPAAESLVAAFRARASAAFIDKRTVRARCSLDTETSTLFTLEVSYAVLSEPLFHRLYGAEARELRAGPRTTLLPFQRRNPYRSRIPLTVTRCDADSLDATLGLITPEMCSGHFPRHPCVPVAILMQSLSHAAGELFTLQTGSPRYVVQRAEVHAHQLAFAGTHVSVETRYVGEHVGGKRFWARAFTAANVTLGELDLVLGASPRLVRGSAV